MHQRNFTRSDWSVLLIIDSSVDLIASCCPAGIKQAVLKSIKNDSAMTACCIDGARTSQNPVKLLDIAC